MEITKEFRNDLLKRKEISLILEADKNPRFDEMKKQIAEHFKKHEDVIDVYNINGSFGSSEFKIDAYIYDSLDDLKKAERKTKKQKETEKKTEEEAEKQSAKA